MEAVAALKKADAYCQAGLSGQRTVLAYDARGSIIGKLSPVDIVAALTAHCKSSKTKTSGWSARLFMALYDRLKKYLSPGCDPLADHWRKAHRVSMFPHIKRASPSSMIGANDTMELAFRLFAAGRQESLFVVQNNEIQGLLLFADVYEEISAFLQSCPLAQLTDRDIGLPATCVESSAVPHGLPELAPAMKTL